MENMYTKKWKHLNMSFSEVKNAKKKTKKKIIHRHRRTTDDINNNRSADSGALKMNLEHHVDLSL